MEPIVIAGAAIVACFAYRAVVDAVHDVTKDGTTGFLLSYFIIICSRFRRHFGSVDVREWHFTKASYCYIPHRYSTLHARKTATDWELLGRTGGRW